MEGEKLGSGYKAPPHLHELLLSGENIFLQPLRNVILSSWPKLSKIQN